jgi:heme-degrading monooxygenase HmoA
VFVRVWLFRPKTGHEDEFAALYGEEGEWTRLFRLGHGYLGTDVQRIAKEPPEYRTVDRWKSREAWNAFRRQHASLYEELDRQGERVTDMEQLVEELDAPGCHE